MDSKRFLLAVALSVAVIFLVQTFVPGAKGPVPHPRADSVAAATTQTQSATATTPGVRPGNTVSAADSTSHTPNSAPILAETTVVSAQPDSGVRYAMSSIGAAPVSVVMNAYENRSKHGGKVDLAAGGKPIIKYQIVTNKQTPVDLSQVPFQTTRTGDVVTYQAMLANAQVAIRYTFVPDSYTVHVAGTVQSPAAGADTYLLVDLPTTFTATESDTADDRNALAYAYYAKRDGARNVSFHSMDPGEKTLASGPLNWVAARSKYFVVGLLAPVNGPLFAEATLVGGNRTSKIATNATATVVVPVKNGAFGFDLYTGPQSLKRLQAQGRDFEEVNPYGFAMFHGVLQPIATGVTRLVLWMHERLALSYGMVLVLLGVLVRLVMWPLNQSSMRTSLKMQAIQPELQRVQERYKNDLDKQRTEVMKVYSEHGMSPLSPLLGCLPMLLPMPILFALFFVFRSTIEFRGVPFLWIHDLSAHDPFFLLPIIMGISMFLLSWIGMRNMPPNPQSKMMSYLMPLIFVGFFVKAAAGLNLYYAMQNIAALPQQWLIARERSKSPAGKPAVQGRQNK